MPLPTRAESQKSFFLFVRDTNTGNVRRLAIPADVQVGLVDNPAGLELFGRLSLSTTFFSTTAVNKGVIELTNHDTIVGITNDITPNTNEINVFLPPNPRDGQVHFIKDVSGTADVTPINIFPTDGVLIDGLSSKTLVDAYASMAVFWYQNNWKVLVSGVGTSNIGAASDQATFITVDSESVLTNSRQFAAGDGISFTDNGPQSTFSVSIDPTLSFLTINPESALPGSRQIAAGDFIQIDDAGPSDLATITAINVAPRTASYITVNNEPGLDNERALVAGLGLSLFDSGPNSAITASINNELTPLGLTMTLVATTSYFDIQPRYLLWVSESFDGSNPFTRFTDANTGSLSISAGQLTITQAAGSTKSDILVTGDDVGMPQVTTVVDVVSTVTGAGVAYDNIGVGIAKDGNNLLYAQWDRIASQARFQIKVTGSNNFRAPVTKVFTPPFQMGFSLVANSATMWAKSGSTDWERITSYNISPDLNAKLSGSLTGWKGSLVFASPATATKSWTFDNFKVGRFGSVGFRDPTLITSMSGDPVVTNDRTVNVMATLVDPQGSGYAGVLELDILSGTLTQRSVLMTQRTGTIQNDLAGQIIVESSSSQHFLVSTWGSGFGGLLRVLYQNVLFENLLTGSHILSGTTTLALTQLPIGGGNYDPYMLRDQSTGLWHMAYTVTSDTLFVGDPFYPAYDTSPNLVTWTNVGSDSSRRGFEGSRIIRMGGAYWIFAGGHSYLNVYNDRMVYNSSMSVRLNGGTSTFPHPMFFPWHDQTYLLTFNSSSIVPDQFTWGQLELYKGPRFGFDSTWVDGRNRLMTTSSVSIDTNARFAEQVGSDVFFYVSGTLGLSGTNRGRRAVFGGDLVSSGSITASHAAFTSLSLGFGFPRTGGFPSLATGAFIQVPYAGVIMAGATSSTGGNAYLMQWGTHVGVQQTLIFGDDENPQQISHHVRSGGFSTMWFGRLNGAAGATERYRFTYDFADFKSGLLFVDRISGSIQQLSGGLSYLVAGANITIASQSNGQVVISSTATITGSGGGAGEVSASYVVLSLTSSLANERVLTAGSGITITDGGPGSTVTISATGGGGSSGAPAGQLAYHGFTTSSVLWSATGSWTAFTGAMGGNFVDNITASITRSNSFFSTPSQGFYYMHAGFNAYGNDAYVSLRLRNSSSNEVVLQRATYRTNPSDQNLVTLDGVFSASTGDSWVLEYVTSGTIFPWTSSNPTPDGSNMRTGEVSMFIIAGTDNFYRRTPISASHIAVWAFDEVTGSTSALNTGTPLTGTLVAAGRVDFGKVGIFEKAIALPTTTAGGLNGAPFILPDKSFSFSGWVFPITFANFGNIMSKWFNPTRTNPFVSFELLINNTGDGQWYYQWARNGTTLEAGETIGATNAANRLRLLQWNHIGISALYEAGVTTIRTYFNGDQVAVSSTIGSLSWNGTGNWVVGNPAPSSTYGIWQGSCDDYRVINEALSSSWFDETYRRGVNFWRP